MNDGDANTLLRRLFAAADERTAAAGAFYSTLERHGQVAARADLTYRCGNPHRCTLLRAYVTQPGTVVHVSRYKLSARANDESSTSAGRAKNTEDGGGNHWRGHTFFLDDAVNVTLSCDHVLGLTIGRERIEREAAARRGDVVVTVADHENPPYAG